jgi:hypothetical protein
MLKLTTISQAIKFPFLLKKKINSKSIFHIEGNYECNQNAEWWFAAAKGIVQIAMPRFSPIGGEPTGVCSGTKQISDTYWKSVYEQIVDTINIFSDFFWFELFGVEFFYGFAQGFYCLFFKE